MTYFTDIYNRFLGKITDDMYLELTPEDTIKDLRNLLIDAIPNFEFPRHNLADYNIAQEIKPEDEVTEDEMIIGLLWDDTIEDDDLGRAPLVVVEKSTFAADLTSEEINILATYMIVEWLGQQLASVENVRMKYSGPDFKFTSQANHMSKILALKKDYEREGFHLQRLYKRRLKDEEGIMRSTFGTIMEKSPEGREETRTWF